MKFALVLGALVLVLTGVVAAQTNLPQSAAPATGKLLSDVAYGRIIKCALRDRAGNLWFGTSWAGALRFDGKSFVRFSAREGLGSEMVNAIYEDKGGALWFGTDRGIFRYDGKAFAAVALPGDEGLPGLSGRPAAMTVATKIVTSITEDKAGNLWFGIWGPPGDAGAYRYDGRQFTRLLREKPTQGIVVDDAGGVWLNSRRYDGQAFTENSSRENAFKEAVFCSLRDGAGNLWFGVRSEGLYRYDGREFTWFSPQAGTFERVTCLFQDRAGRLWVGGDIRFATGKGGLCYFDGKAFVRFPQIYDLGMYAIWGAAEDSDGNLWFGGRGGKLLRYDGKSFVDFSDELERAAEG